MQLHLFIPYIKVFTAFMVMLAFIRLALGVGLSILIGSFLMALFFGIWPHQWLLIAMNSLIDPKLMLLTAIVVLIMVLSELLQHSGQSKRIMDSLSSVLRWPKLRIIFFPALIGLLPMPGGAVFSAPMVKTASSEFNLPQEKMVFINYWFRHVWELAWPLYPGIILAAYLAEVPIFKLIGFTWPSLILCFFLGWLFFLRSLSLEPSLSCTKETFNLGSIITESGPLLLALAGTLFLEASVFVLNLPVPSELGFVIALLGSITLLLCQNRISLQHLLPIICKKHLLQMIFAVLAIFVFKGILEQGGIIVILAQGAQSHTTLILIAALLPLLVGLIAGITIAFVGATFPLIIGITHQLGIDNHLYYLILALFSGYCGILASPIHICFLLTCEFFHVNVAQAWKKLILPCLCLFAFGLAYFALLNYCFT